MTDPDRSGWGRSHRKQVHSVQVYRQKPIGNYFVDFYAPKAKMVVEGLWLPANMVASKQIEGVMEVILRAISESLEANPPNPPFRKGGERIGAPLPSEGSVRGDGLRSCSF